MGLIPQTVLGAPIRSDPRAPCAVLLAPSHVIGAHVISCENICNLSGRHLVIFWRLLPNLMWRRAGGSAGGAMLALTAII